MKKKYFINIKLLAQCCNLVAECYNSFVTNFIYEALSLASWTASDPDGTYTAMLCFFRLPFLKESITFSSDADIADETRFYEREIIENTRLEIIPVNYKLVSNKKKYLLHTGTFDSNVSQISKYYSKFGLLYDNGLKAVLGVK